MVHYLEKKELLEKYNLHTVIRLPESVFAPYTGIETNILFFDEGKPTKDIWFYRMKVRDGLKNYTKTNPMQDSDFEDVLKWSKNKVENNYGYKKSVEDLIDYDLDVKHPDDKEIPLNITPRELIGKIIEDQKNTLDLLTTIEELIDKEIPN